MTTVNEEYDILPPTFTDLNLTGCFAGTGGWTTRTFTSGEIDLPQTDYSFIGTNEDFVASMACSDFMTQENAANAIEWTFQRSPICTSYHNWFSDNNCERNHQVLMPPGVTHGIPGNEYHCCGGCNIFDPPHVRVLYWPPETPSDCSNQGTTTKGNSLLSEPTVIKPRSEGDQSVTSPRLAVVEGVTLTSPSLYLTFSGILHVTDKCGFLGANYTSPIIPVPAGGLSTLSYKTAFRLQQGVETGAYDPAACATYGASNKTTKVSYFSLNSEWVTYSDHFTFGPPYNPILVPPPEVYNFDPAWAACPEWYTLGEAKGGFTYGLFDPPKMLTPVAMADGPSSTSAGSTTQHITWATPTQAARPGSTGIPDAPRATVEPGSASDPSQAAPDFDTPSGSVNDATSPDLPVARDPIAPVDASSQDASSSGTPSGNSPGREQQTPADFGRQDEKSPLGNLPEQLQRPSVDFSAQVGSSTAASFRESPKQVQPYPVDTASQGRKAAPDGPPKPLHQPLIVDSDPVYRVGEETLLPGGPTITIKNVPYALASSADALVSGSETLALAELPSAPTISETSGHLYTADDTSRYLLGSKTILPGASAFVVDVLYSIPSSANVIISNGNTASLVAKPGNPPVLTIAGQIITADARPRVTVDHQELIAGGSTITISSTPYALAPSGTALIAGSSTIAIKGDSLNISGELFASQITSASPTSEGGELTFIIGSTTTILAASADGLVVTIDPTPYTANTASAFLIGTQNLVPGSSALTIGSTVYFIPTLYPSSDSRSSTLPSDSVAGEIVLTVASEAYTCHQNSPCSIASQILLPNGTITVGADTIVYGERGIDVVRATTTVVQGSSTLSRGDVITTHIDGLIPIGEEVETAAAATGLGAGDSEGKGRINRVDIAMLYIVLVLIGLLL